MRYGSMPLTTTSQSSRRTRATNFSTLRVHPGLIVLREGGLSREEQWQRIRPVMEHVQHSGDPDFLLNKLIEVTGVAQFEVRDIPRP
jgi:hypothetical protein